MGEGAASGRKSGLQAPGLPFWSGGATGVGGWGLSAANRAAPHLHRFEQSGGAEAGSGFPTLQPDSLGTPRHAHLTPPHPVPPTACGRLQPIPRAGP